MNFNKEMQSNVDMIETLASGGMLVAAKNLLNKIHDEYLEVDDRDHTEACFYLKYILKPKIGGKSPLKIPNSELLKLGAKLSPIGWSQWLSRFPNTTVEFMEDKQKGRNIQLNLKNIHLLTKKQLYDAKAGLFYTPNGFNESVRSGMSRRREVGNVKSINAVFIDMDGAPTRTMKEVHHEAISRFPILPSYIVETKNGYHVLWLLEPGYGQESVARWKNIQKGLIAHFDSDKACSDIARLLRMPNSWHCKDLWEGGEGFFVELMFESDRKYTLDDFKIYEPAIKKWKTKELLGPGRVVAPEVSGLSVGDRHPTLIEEAARTYARLGNNRDLAAEARSVIKEWYRASCVDLKTHWESEVDDCCDWVELNQFGTK